MAADRGMVAAERQAGMYRELTSCVMGRPSYNDAVCKRGFYTCTLSISVVDIYKRSSRASSFNG